MQQEIHGIGLIKADGIVEQTVVVARGGGELTAIVNEVLGKVFISGITNKLA